jgi:hypothetical protein
MSPLHQGFVRELRTGTALLLSASWLVSENVRAARIAALEHRYILTDAQDAEYFRSAGLERTPDGGLQQQIQGAILLSEVKANLKEMH